MASPTYLVIKNSKDPIPIEKGGTALIRLETDAEDSYYEDSWDEHFRCIHTKGITTKKSSSRLRKGKISYHIFCPDSVRVGTEEEIRFELDLKEGGLRDASRKVVCVHPYERKKVTTETRMPDPKIITVSKEGNPVVWGQFGWDNEAVGRVVIETENAGIYVSVDNKELKNIARKHDSVIAKTIEDRYVAGAAYYLLLKQIEERKIKPTSTSDEGVISDGDSSLELRRLAKVLSAMAIPVEEL